MTAQPLVPVFSVLPYVRPREKTRFLPMLAAIVGTLVLISPYPVAAALLEGQTVQTTDFHGTAPDTNVMVGPVASVVGPGIELTSFGYPPPPDLGFLDINFSDTNILITAATDQPFGFSELLRFLVSSTNPGFNSVTVNSATNWAGFNASKIFFTSDRIDLNLTALEGLQGQQISLDLSGNAIPPKVVPEPPAYLLLGIALLGMLGIGRQKSQPRTGSRSLR